MALTTKCLAFLVLVSGLFVVSPADAKLKLLFWTPDTVEAIWALPLGSIRVVMRSITLWILARYVREHLVKAGIKTVLTREDDRDMALFDRIGMANRMAADALSACISTHQKSLDQLGTKHFSCRWSPPMKPLGAFVCLESADPTAVRSATTNEIELPTVNDILLDLTRNQAHGDAQKLAAMIQERTTPQSPFKNRGVKQAPFFVLMGASMPAVVVEIGFINHRREGKFITSDKGMRAMALGIAQGIIDFGQVVHATEQKEVRPDE